MELGRYGVWVGRTLPADLRGEAACLAQSLGFGTIWLGGSPRLTDLRPMLEASESVVVASGIVNVWQYEPAQLAAEYDALERDFPGRVLVGIGIGHREATQAYRAPLETMQGFLDGIERAARAIPRERMVLAALGPKMLALAARRTLGTHPYFTPPAHTSLVRSTVGPSALVAPEQAVVVRSGEETRAAARSTAREYAAYYLRLRNYASNLARLGYGEHELEDGGSDRLIDELVPQGRAREVAPSVRAHLEAGADHVCVQAVGVAGVPERAWRELAAELL